MPVRLRTRWVRLLLSVGALLACARVEAQAYPDEPSDEEAEMTGADLPSTFGVTEPTQPPESAKSAASDGVKGDADDGNARAAERHVARLLKPYQQAGSLKSPGFLLHDSNYFGVMAAGDEPGRVKFQISVRYELLTLGSLRGYSWSLAYTQKALWDLFKLDASAPFVENNYRPETFFAYRPARSEYTEEYAVGFLHESNGLGLTKLGDLTGASKSWNNAYVSARRHLTPIVGIGRFRFQVVGAARAWLPIAVDAGDDPQGDRAIERAANRRMRRNLGYGSLTLDLRFGSAWMYPSGKLANENRGLLRIAARQRSAETSLYVPLPCKAWIQAAFFLQFFAGKAERLMMYDRTTTNFYVGIGLL